MDSSLFFKGLALGFSVAIPVGPINLLCIRRTICEGRLSGFVTGLGAATADAFYGFIAAFGVSLLWNLLIGNAGTMRLIGGIFLCFMGVRTFFTHPAITPAQPRRTAKTHLGAFVSTLFLTLTNPMTIIAFSAAFLALGIGGVASDNASALAVVAGVFAGSTLWWGILAGSVGAFRERFDFHGLRRLNRISGVAIALFGIGLLLYLVPSVRAFLP
jgi:threonine/homoserine/homoserine lactone efflux protein